MKTLLGLLLFVLLGIVANGQQSGGAKVIAEISASSDKVIKGAPFSAEAVSESVQVLADGNRIVRSSTSKLYRNSEGRFRQEMTGGTGGMVGPMYSYGQGISILDPVGGYRVLLDSNLRTARQMIFKPMGELKLKSGMTEAEKKEAVDKLKAEIKAVAVETSVVAVRATTGQIITQALSGVGSVGFAYSTGGHSKYEMQTEQLGVQNFEGVDAEGTRTTTTIPAGDIGNERPIEIVYEKWYSKELQLVVMSKHSDPRFGEQTYRLTNIVRSEPDPSLFSVPNGYRLITEPTNVYKVSTAKGDAQTVVAVRPTIAVTVAKPAKP